MSYKTLKTWYNTVTDRHGDPVVYKHQIISYDGREVEHKYPLLRDVYEPGETAKASELWDEFHEEVKEKPFNFKNTQEWKDCKKSGIRHMVIRNHKHNGCFTEDNLGLYAMPDPVNNFFDLTIQLHSNNISHNVQGKDLMLFRAYIEMKRKYKI